MSDHPMTSIEFDLAYQPKAGPPRIGRAVVDVRSVDGNQAPVALLMPASERDIHLPERKESGFRYNDGHYWTEVASKPVSDRSDPISLDSFRKFANSMQREDFAPDGLAVSYNPFIEKSYGPDDIVRQAYGPELERDSKPMSKELLASESWQLVSEQAGRTILVDGIFHQKSTGPVIYISMGTPKWTLMDRGTPRWFSASGMFPYWEADIAAEFCRLRYGKELDLAKGTGPEVLQDFRPLTNFQAAGLEESAASLLRQTGKTLLSAIDPRMLPIVAGMRRSLENRLPLESIVRKGMRYIVYPRHPSDMVIPDATDIEDLFKQADTFSHPSSSYVGAVLDNLHDRAQAIAATRDRDADLIGAAFG